jgi:hypothetical protein
MCGEMRSRIQVAAALLCVCLAATSAFAANATLTFHFTVRGTALQDPLQARFYVYPPDDDETYLAWGHAARSVTVPQGVYNVVIKYANGAVTRQQVLAKLDLRGDVVRDVDFDVEIARLAITITSGGVAVPRFAGSFNLYRPGERGTPLLSLRPGETATAPPGRYDVEVLYRGPEGLESKWLEGYALEGERQEVVEVGRGPERPLEAKTSTDRLTVNVRNRGSREPSAWCGVYAAGDRARELYAGASGEAIAVQPGSYDIGCFLHRGGLSGETWLAGQVVSGSVELEADLDLVEASLRVREGKSGRGGGSSKTPPNLLLVVDSSAAMAGQLDGRPRLEQLGETLEAAFESLVGTDTGVGLRVFGIAPLEQRQCEDSTLLVPAGRLDRRALTRSLDMLRPTGRSPIARSLELAPADLRSTGARYVLLITGGPESCGGDVCAAAARAVREGGLSRIYVVSLAGSSGPVRPLDCVGDHRIVRSKLELDAALRDILREVRRGGAGSVAVFSRGNSRLVTSGPLSERLVVAEGTYDVLVRVGDDTWTWPALEIRGSMDAVAGPRP